MNKTSAVLNIIADVMVRTNQTCLSSASNSMLMQFGKAREVTIENLDSTNTSSTQQNCIHVQNVQIGPLHSNLQAALQQKMATAAGRLKGDTAKLIANITESISVSVVSTCLAVAVNQIGIRIQNITGKVYLKDIRLTETATASVAQCLTKDSVRVGDVPLSAYLDANSDRFELDTVKPVTVNTTDSINVVKLSVMSAAAVIYIILILVALLKFKNYI